MTGWRVAFAAAPPEILGAMVKIHQYTMLCAPGPSQAAAVEPSGRMTGSSTTW